MALLMVQATAFATTETGPTPVPTSVKCDVVSTSTIDDPGRYNLKDAAGDALQIGVPVTFPDIVLFKAYCYVSEADVKLDKLPVQNLIDSIKFPACGSDSNVCTVYQATEKNVQLTKNRTLVAEVLVQNKTDKTVVINEGEITGHVEQVDEAPALFQFTRANWKNPDTPIYPPLRNGKCRVIVSGALDPIPENEAIPEVRVSNGKLLFTASVTGVTGQGAEVTSIKWNGGPNQNGLWENPPLNVVSTVSANVKIKAGQALECSIKVKPVGQNYSIGLSRYGDCGFFGGLRRYYFWDKANKAPQTTGYKPEIMFPGNEAKYGKSAPEIPFRGVLNAAASIQGAIEVGTNGEVVHPTVEYRKFAKAVIVAKSFNPANNKVGDDPIAWGELDLSNYALSQMALLQNVGENETVVFQAYLARSIIKDGKELRGSSDPGGFPLYSMDLAGDDGTPADYIVPFVNASCSVMTIGVPTRSDKEIGPELAGVQMCTFSKPYQLKDLASGRVSLEIMHLVPEYATHSFPPNLVKSMAKNEATCNANDPVKKECWDIKASQLGVSTEKPFETHDQCREVKTVTKNTTVCNKYGCQTVSVPTTMEVYKPGCNIVEQAECGPTMAVRFSGYNQMMLGALGCAAKYQRAGENVTATLENEGIIPYTSFGGDSPKHYTKYKPAFGQTNGYACIPCRFAGDATKAGTDLKSTTKPIPVDDDPSNPRLPIYSFKKSTAPRDCVKDVTFTVRYFGSGVCDGVNAPPGHFCSSNNISQQNCTTSDTAMTASNPTSGGGNIAGQFRIPVCPGSGLDYNEVAVSWSPIIVDIAGNGITVSRSFDLARQFDIRGDGRARVLDWPINNDEVAFLVRPDKKGNVTSIKELFGDYKAKNGFLSLAKLDSNKDGKINRKDKAFKELGLWFDRNRNAKVDPGEIEALEIHGVFELPLQYTNYARKGAEGKTLTSSYFNHKHKRYMNVEDHYFYEYISSGQKMSQK
ncbi:MAG: hypothetical protein KF767_00135 [Bdellovibrionaceae bacterium]|nr:hypothetical protein [Pseudobdellovibrionaceae bacterium]